MSHDIQAETLTAGTWAIDNSHSEVGFSVRHLMSKVRGTFADFSGEIITKSDDPTESSVNVAIKVSSISTNNSQRDGHLKSTDFFDADAGQEITFASTAITAKGDGYVISGDLTINGITKSVDLAAEFLGVAGDAYGATRLGAEASVTINRSDYKVDFNVPLEGDRLLIGDKVDISISLQAVKS
ncbi:YceI family protein [Microlunatus parietis]|uniref:Polyisoprenoid-binding protein YceI n=1 Tax=Microlunatus parietis TaxID=682979 RepID=A0A7Y9I4Z6_9ACTN|nr:YceI family protein [Microlunatus parietis]NYE70193.1 polyisoprenoid-binding protein YceI [Microlunatus parietis]